MKCVEVVVREAAEDGVVGADIEDLEESFGKLEVDWGVSHSLRVISYLIVCEWSGGMSA